MEADSKYSKLPVCEIAKCGLFLFFLFYHLGFSQHSLYRLFNASLILVGAAEV